MNKLVSIVHNSVTRDTRVQKEAISLSESLNCNYTIIGLKDKNDKQEHTQLTPRVDIIRLTPTPLKVKFSKMPIIKNSIFLGKFITATSLLACLILLNTLLLTTIQTIQNFAFYYSLLLIPLLGLGAVSLKLMIKHRRRLRRNISSISRRISLYIPLYEDLKVTLLSLARYKQFAELYRPTLEELQPDVIHAHDVPMLVVATKFKEEFPAVKIVFDAHELFEHMSSRGLIFRVTYRRYLRKMSKSVDSFVTINQSFHDYFKKHYPNMPKANIVKNATPKSQLLPEKPQRNRLREILPIPAERKILLYQGGYSRPRGLDLVIDSFREVNSDWVLVFMGWGNIEEELKAKALQVDPNGQRIFFIPPAPLSELRDWTSGADLGIIPYLNTCLNHFYCTPNKLWEYPVARVPFLAPDYPELGAAIKKYDIGWTLRAMSPNAIATALNSVTDIELEEKSKAFDKYLELDGWEVSSKNLTEAYLQIP